MTRLFSIVLTAALASVSAADDRSSVVPGTVVETPAFERTFDGWDEEAFSIPAGERLGDLVHWISGEDPEAAPPGGAVAAPLRPDGRRVVLDDGVTSVARVSGSSAAPGASAGKQPLESAAAGLRGLFVPAPGGDPSQAAHGKAKIVTTRRAGDGRWRSDVLVQIAGPEATEVGAAARLQVNARWQVDWTGTIEDPVLEAIEVVDHEEVRVAGGGGGGFVDATAAVLGHLDAFRDDLRLGTDHWLDRIEEGFGITVGGWNGLALGDVDGDGVDDLYVCTTGGLPNRLFVRRADGGIEERAAEAGVDWLECTQAAVFADFDNDGDQDLAISTLTGVLIHSNDGAGNFVVRAALPFPGAMPYSLAVADYDLDGDLDLFAACYSTRNLLGDQRAVFERPLPYHDARNGGRNVLLRNEGGWRWRHATREAGLDENDRRFSYAASWEDYDHDGDPDLYIANDFGRNTLYRNDYAGPGQPVRFTEVAIDAGVEDIAAGMSVAWGDYDNDGNADLHVGNMFSSAGNRIARLGGFLPEADAETRGLFLRHARGNSLFRNRGDGTFEDVSEPAGVTLGRWAWGSRFADLNNDGWKDLVVANGFITQEDPGDL